jgi:hypothetical protein
MGLKQHKDGTVFRVSLGASGQWDVRAKGFDKPLASFDRELDACSHANGLARSRHGSKVVVEVRKLTGTLRLPAHARR